MKLIHNITSSNVAAHSKDLKKVVESRAALQMLHLWLQCGRQLPVYDFALRFSDGQGLCVSSPFCTLRFPCLAARPMRTGMRVWAVIFLAVGLQ